MYDHDQKAAVIWASFKDRIGIQTDSTRDFDISHLIMDDISLDLDRPFSNEEIDEVIKCMPNDKFPGPDGFNGIFMKRNVGTSSSIVSKNS